MINFLIVEIGRSLVVRNLIRVEVPRFSDGWSLTGTTALVASRAAKETVLGAQFLCVAFIFL